MSGSSPQRVWTITLWLQKGYSDINIRVAKAGYVAPVTDTAAICYDMLAHLNDLFAGAVAEKSWGVARGDLEAEEQGATYWAMYLAGIKDLLDGNGELIGLTVAGDAPTRRKIRTVQMRKEDGFSTAADSSDYDTLAAHLELEGLGPLGFE